MSEQRKAVILLALTAVLWSLAGTLIKWIEWNPMAISATRSMIAAVVLLAVVRRRNFTWSAAQIGGALAYAATVILFVIANKWTTAANAILLQYAAPVWIALFSPWFLEERTRWFDWLVMTLIIGGMVLFFLDKLSTHGFWGNIVAIITSVSFAWVALFLRKQKTSSPFESVFLGNIIAAAVGLPFVVGSLPTTDGSVGLAWLLLGVLGVFQLGLSYILYSIAIKKVTAIEAMLIPAIEPILNPLMVVLLYGERPGAWAVVGGVIVLGAVAMRGLLTMRTPRAALLKNPLGT